MFKQALNSKKKIILAIFMGIVVVLYLSSLAHSYQRLSGAEKLLKDAENKKIELEKEKQELQLELENVETEGFKEYLARDKLGLIKEGEYVVVLPDEEILRRLSPREIEESGLKLPGPNWRKWEKALFGV